MLLIQKTKRKELVNGMHTWIKEPVFDKFGIGFCNEKCSSFQRFEHFKHTEYHEVSCMCSWDANGSEKTESGTVCMPWLHELHGEYLNLKACQEEVSE